MLLLVINVETCRFGVKIQRMIDLEVNNGVAAGEVPQLDIALSRLLASRRSSQEVPVGCDDKHRAALVRGHTSYNGVFLVVDCSELTSIVDVEDDHVAASSGVDEQQGQHRGVRRHGQLQQPAVLVERQDGIAGARRDVPDVDAEAADVSVAAVARRQTEMILDKYESNVCRRSHAVHWSFVHLFVAFI